jgi:RNA polymerase sigma factor (sigma-70 family)
MAPITALPIAPAPAAFRTRVARPDTHPRTPAPQATPAPGARPVRERLREMPEQELATIAMAGDEVAWDILFARAYPALVGFALSLGMDLDGDQAADLAQETLVRAWTMRDRFDPSGSFRSWTLVVLERLARNEVRRRRRFVSGGDALELPPTGEMPWAGSVPGVGLDAIIDAQEEDARLDRLRRAMRHLAPEDRRLLTAVSRGERLVDMAARQDVVVSTLRWRLFRARQRLAERFHRLAERPVRRRGAI